MIFNLKTTIDPKEAANFIADSILKQLELGKHVLFFVTGGSSIEVGVKVAERLRAYPKQNLIKNLTIMLTDERYGPVDHGDSNWYQLMKEGFMLGGAGLIPILTGAERDTTVKNFNEILNQEFNIHKENKYKIGLFGIGADGHTAGILPESEAVNSPDLVYGYDTSTFSRITITPKAIEKLDETVAWVQGENKWEVIKNLKEKDIPARNASGIADAGGDLLKQPAQVLKKVPQLTIFTNYKE